jgi:hypothetical protein
MIQEYTVKQLVEKYGVPERIVRGIKAYVEERRPVGHFLQAVIQNDLSEAINRADYEVALCLQGIVRIFYNQVPGIAWKSKERYEAWLNREDQK